jgi:methanogenic corrinoid protein MtbC1
MGDLAQALADLEEKKVYELVDEKIKQGVNVLNIIQECNTGMVRVGELFSEGTYFISQLIFSAEILNYSFALLTPIG